MKKGDSHTFRANVIGDNNPTQTVIWSIYGGNGSTSIDSNGKLTVDSNETADILNIRAISTIDSTKSGSATVSIVSPARPPIVLSVEIIPNAITISRGNSYTFTPNVIGVNNPSQSVDWSVSGGVVGTNINSNGVLTVDSSETSNMLTVRATSTFDNSKFATATVTVAQVPVIDAQIPCIITNPKSATVYVGKKVELSVFANITDGGDLSYQWYSNNINSNTDGTLINGATNATYTPSTSTSGVTYYYVKIINTNVGLTGNTIASITSNPATVSVNYFDGSGGSNGGSSSSSRGSNNPNNVSSANTVSTSNTVNILINGQTANATINNEGVLEISYMALDFKKYVDSSGNYVIEIGEQNNIMLSIPISAIENNNLTIKTDFGAISVSNKTLQSLLKLYNDDIVRLALKKGSFIVTLADADGKEINYNDPENPLTITLPHALTTGQEADSIIAVKKTNENKSIIPFATYKDGKVIFSTDSTGIYDLIYNPKAFQDTENHWANPIISFVSARELFTGTGNGIFSPDGTMTRGMFLTVLSRLDGSNLSQYKTSRFNDVPFGEWYSSSIEWAADKGLVTGIGNGKFDPNAPITREQMAVVLNNYIEYKGYEIKHLSDKLSFSDDFEISSWAKKAVENIQRVGIISEKSNNMYEPQGLSTRAETANIFVKFVEACNEISF